MVCNSHANLSSLFRSGRLDRLTFWAHAPNTMKLQALPTSQLASLIATLVDRGQPERAALVAAEINRRCGMASK